MIEITMSPSMENAELWAFYTSHRNLRRKYLTYNDEKLAIKLSPEAELYVKERKRAKSRVSFNRYLEKHRDDYNTIYRERYHILKARKAAADQESESDTDLVIELE